MTKTQHKISFITILGLFLFFGPILTSESLGDAGWAGIPKALWYIFGIWGLLIVAYAALVKYQEPYE